MDLSDTCRKPDDVNLSIDDETGEYDNTIILNDEAGNEIEFEFLDAVECDGKEYVILLPIEALEGEVVIFRVEGEDGNESYIGVDEVEEAEKVFTIFKNKNKDDFEFID